MKICNKCNVEKELEFFNKRKCSKDGYVNRCKSCDKEYNKKYYTDNKDFICERSKQYRSDNLDYIIECDRLYKKSNKIKISESNKRYQENNKDLIRERNENYYNENRNEILITSNEYNKNNRSSINRYVSERRKYDPLFKLCDNIRNLIKQSLKKNGFVKNSNTECILSCNFDKLLEHLNMNDYGFVYGDDNLDIDHIIPLSSASTMEEIYELNHYSNLQLLPSYYNRYVKRSNKFDKFDFENWLNDNH